MRLPPPCLCFPSLPLLLLALLLVASLPAQAMYRCSSGGSTTYSDTPCASGQSVAVLAPADVPDPATAREVARKTARDQAELNRLRSERERRAAQEESARNRAEAGRLAHQKKCKLLDMKKRWSEEDAAHADAKREARARRSQRRKQEQYALECGAQTGM
ncbi:MAG: hypothetical protein JWP36_2482 [Paucimonas sp.]|nr:hypothetical protein [Paucimonas sp.]